MSFRISWRIRSLWFLSGRETGNFLGILRKVASSISWMRFVAPNTQILAGRPCWLDDVKPSHRVMNLYFVSVNYLGVIVVELLGLDHAAGLMLATSTSTEDSVDFVNKNDSRLHLSGQGEYGADNLVRVSIPFLC